MSILIAGIGTAVPPHRISQVDAAEIAKQYSCETAAQERLFLTLYRRAGVEGRNCVVLNKSDGPLDGRQSFYTSSDPTPWIGCGSTRSKPVHWHLPRVK